MLGFFMSCLFYIRYTITYLRQEELKLKSSFFPGEHAHQSSVKLALLLQLHLQVTTDFRTGRDHLQIRPLKPPPLSISPQAHHQGFYCNIWVPLYQIFSLLQSPLLVLELVAIFPGNREHGNIQPRHQLLFHRPH